MRINSFLLGAIVGAIAIMYTNSSNRKMMVSLINSASGSMGKIFDTTMNRVNFGTHRDGMDKVEKIVNDDPKLKHEVDQIMNDKHDESNMH